MPSKSGKSSIYDIPERPAKTPEQQKRERDQAVKVVEELEEHLLDEIQR